MPRKRHSKSEIAAALTALNDGMSPSDVAAKFKVTLQTVYRWKRLSAESTRSIGKTLGVKSGKASETKSLQELREENIRLRLLIADLLMKGHEAA